MNVPISLVASMVRAPLAARRRALPSCYGSRFTRTARTGGRSCSRDLDNPRRHFGFRDGIHKERASVDLVFLRTWLAVEQLLQQRHALEKVMTPRVHDGRRGGDAISLLVVQDAVEVQIEHRLALAHGRLHLAGLVWPAPHQC